MKKLIITAAFSLLSAALFAQAANTGVTNLTSTTGSPVNITRTVNGTKDGALKKDIKRDEKDIRNDIKDVRNDIKDLKADIRQRRMDIKNGDKAAALALTKDIIKDKTDIRKDRRDIRMDKRDLRRDVRHAKKIAHHHHLHAGRTTSLHKTTSK